MIEIYEFDGDTIQGAMSAKLELGEREHRILHCFLLKAGTVDRINLDIPKTATLEEIKRIADELHEFAEMAQQSVASGNAERMLQKVS